MNKKELIKLITLAKNKDNEAIGQLIKLTKDKLYFYANVILKNSNDAEEACQEAYIRAFERLDDLQDVTKFESWLISIVRNCAMRLATKQVTTFSAIEEDFDIESTIVDEKIENRPDLVLDQKVKQQMIQEILSDIPSDQKQVIMMYYFEDLKIKDIAESLNVSENTVKSRMNYAKSKIGEKVLEIQKNYDIKLYNVTPISFFSWLMSTCADDLGIIVTTTSNTELVVGGLAASFEAIKGALASKAVLVGTCTILTVSSTALIAPSITNSYQAISKNEIVEENTTSNNAEELLYEINDNDESMHLVDNKANIEFVEYDKGNVDSEAHASDDRNIQGVLVDDATVDGESISNYTGSNSAEENWLAQEGHSIDKNDNYFAESQLPQVNHSEIVKPIPPISTPAPTPLPTPMPLPTPTPTPIPPTPTPTPESTTEPQIKPEVAPDVSPDVTEKPSETTPPTTIEPPNTITPPNSEVPPTNNGNQGDNNVELPSEKPNNGTQVEGGTEVIPTSPPELPQFLPAHELTHVCVVTDLETAEVCEKEFWLQHGTEDHFITFDQLGPIEPLGGGFYKSRLGILQPITN